MSEQKIREVEMICEIQKTQDDTISVYYGVNAEACEERQAYARIDTKTTGDKEKQSYFIYCNGGRLCDPSSYKRRPDSQAKSVKYQNFLHYINFLIKGKMSSYVAAQKYE